MAGQFAKPRSEPFEVRDGMKLPSYRRNNVNGDDFDEKSRRPDPQRLLRAYLQSVGTLNLLRAFATGGYAAMQRVSDWNLDFIEHSEQGNRYMEFAERVDEATGFLSAAGATRFFVTWVSWIRDWLRKDRLKSNNDFQVNGSSAA